MAFGLLRLVALLHLVTAAQAACRQQNAEQCLDLMPDLSTSISYVFTIVCDSLYSLWFLTTHHLNSCDCYTFCDGSYNGCDSSVVIVSCGGELVTGCTDEDREPANVFGVESSAVVRMTLSPALLLAMASGILWLV